MRRASDVDDRELLARTRAGDAEAFGVFYRAHRDDVLGSLSRRIPTAEIAADVMCETFAKVLVAVHRPDQELPEVPVGWLLTIARNELIDSIRRGRVADDTRCRLAMEPLELSDGDQRRLLVPIFVVVLAAGGVAAAHSVQKELQHVSYALYSRSYTHCYTAASIRTLVAKWFATMGMVRRFATVSRPKGERYEPASRRLYLAGCVRFNTAWTGNNNKFVDVELIAKDAALLPAGQFFPPAKDFTSSPR